MRPSDRYQVALIALGLIATVMFAFFLKREVLPEYKIYQNDFIALEKFRSSYTGEPSPQFQTGVKQILLTRTDTGPAAVDRCISCHVALQISDYSPTKIVYDINGKIQLDTEGNSLQGPNEDYIWKKLDDKISDLRDPKVIEHLKQSGQSGQVAQRLKLATEYEKLKTAKVDEALYDVTKVLAMHPLIGKETRPFEFHPLEEYGCVSCHSGNGRGLTTDKAHGPILDGTYEEAETGHKEVFLESDPKNDPPFSRMFNHMPGDKLQFQTTPLLMGSLIEAKCIQCHKSSAKSIQDALFTTGMTTKYSENRFKSIDQAYQNRKNELIALVLLKNQISKTDLKVTEERLKNNAEDYSLPVAKRLIAEAQLKYFSAEIKDKLNQTQAIETLSKQIEQIIGSTELSQEIEKKLIEAEENVRSGMVDQFVAQNKQDSGATGTLFIQAATLNIQNELSKHIRDTQTSFSDAISDPQFMSALTSDIDLLTKNYTKGQELYITQACYACHRISGMARGGVGPELTYAGTLYPWYLKESIVWPQADLPTSTMPNYRLDHEELEKLMTFLFGQTGKSRTESDTAYKIAMQEWDAGRKTALEKPITPAQMHDVKYGMTVFATQGCAACHRLKGFESNVGFAIEKDGKAKFFDIYESQQWFSSLFPEEVDGSQIVSAIESNQEEIDKRIVNDVRQNGLLDEINHGHPGQIESFYSNFKYAARAKNSDFAEKIAAETDPAKRVELENELKNWKDRVERILLIYVQEYGLGRLIGPRPNWSGIYRSDEWLMEHFRNPILHVPGSIMPVFPFDDTKFYALTNMLDTLAIRNRDSVREIWKLNGFDPALAANIFCSQCHGEFLQGNGPVSEWIYPIPKNLRNADFLRNMTKENVVNSITHGISGTPMPPWGEVASDKPTSDGIPVLSQGEIKAIADWLFSQVPGGSMIRESTQVPKWQYQPEDVIEELKQEKGILKSIDDEKKADDLSTLFPTGDDFYAAIEPTVNNSSSEVGQFFDSSANTKEVSGRSYYIKKKFYITENIDKGRSFFLNNCAVCHGSEADGSGIRSEIMQDAKPRMLINLDWQKAHDDLYMLRSIKYGVPGTSMTPWGDLTSSLQRMQLVIYIRSKLEEQRNRDLLLTATYKAFDSAMLTVERGRIQAYEQLEALQKQYQDLDVKRKTEEEKLNAEDAVKLYKELYSLSSKLNDQKKIDQIFLKIKEQVKMEEEAYRQLGFDLLAQKMSEAAFSNYLKTIEFYEKRYVLEDHKLKLKSEINFTEKVEELQKLLLEEINKEIARLEAQITVAEGKIVSNERNEEIAHFSGNLKGLKTLKNSVITNLAEVLRADAEQRKLVKSLPEEMH